MEKIDERKGDRIDRREVDKINTLVNSIKIELLMTEEIENPRDIEERQIVCREHPAYDGRCEGPDNIMTEELYCSSPKNFTNCMNYRLLKKGIKITGE